MAVRDAQDPQRSGHKGPKGFISRALGPTGEAQGLQGPREWCSVASGRWGPDGRHKAQGVGVIARGRCGPDERHRAQRKKTGASIDLRDRG